MKVAPHLATHWRASWRKRAARGRRKVEGAKQEATAATRCAVAAREGEVEVGAREVAVVASTSSRGRPISWNLKVWCRRRRLKTKRGKKMKQLKRCKTRKSYLIWK